MILRIFPALFICFSTFTTINAQSFGFGCLGFVGGYGGFSYQEYKAEGLNNYINVFNDIRSDSLVSPMESFSKAQGYRVGLNFFRAKVENFVLTTKGYYQSISEKHEALEKFAAGTSSTTMKLEIRNWGIGVDLGISLTKWMSWKVVDGAVHFNNITFTNTSNPTGGNTKIMKYRNASANLGYSIGTGFILEIIDEYFSIEGSAGYTKIDVDNLQMDDGTLLTENETTEDLMSDFINAGGFSAVIQLNVGFPL